MMAMQRLQQYQQETNRLMRAEQGSSAGAAWGPGGITPEQQQQQQMLARQFRMEGLGGAVGNSEATLQEMLTRK